MAAMTSGVRDDLPSDINVSYGSLTLPTNLLITSFHTTPIWDRAGRTIIALTHRVGVRFWLNSYDPNNPGDSLDNSPTVNVPSIRTQLLQPANQLTLINTAFGNYVVNPTEAVFEALVEGEKAVYDVSWGPKPISFTQKPHYKYAAEIDWTVEFQINACVNQENTNLILEYNYSADWSYDQSGYCTRTYKGTITIPMTRKSVNDRTLPLVTVDSFREKVTPPLAIGFRRTTFQWNLSEDKRSLSFTIVDAQMPPNIPPEGCVIAEASHSVENDFKDMARSVQTIRASYELTSDRARAEAFLHFQALVKDRTALARQKLLTIIPLRFHASEPEIYGRRAAEFSLSYILVHTQARKRTTKVEWPPQAILQESGLWKAVSGANWNNWSKSLVTSKVMTPRGTSDMHWNSYEDAIVDLCSTTQPVPPAEVPSIRRLNPVVNVAAASYERVDPEDSFLRYELALEVQVLDNTVVLQTLPTEAISYNPPSASTSANVGYVQPYPDVPDSIVQYRGAPKYVLKMWGRCLRAAYDVTPPQVVNFGSQPPMPFNDASCYFRSAVVANLGVPIVAAMWKFQYLLASAPSESFVAPLNPLYGGTAQDQAELRELKGGVQRG